MSYQSRLNNLSGKARRFCQCLEGEMNAASSRGKPLTALGHAPGAQCNLIPSSGADRTAYASLLARRRAKKCRALYLNPRRNQSAKKYSIKNTTIAPPMIHRIGSLDFGGSYE